MLQVTKLIKLQQKSKDSVIVFSPDEFEEFAVSKGRDYHLVFFLNANYLAGNAKMNLPKLKQEFALAAKVSSCVAYHKNGSSWGQ